MRSGKPASTRIRSFFIISLSAATVGLLAACSSESVSSDSPSPSASGTLVRNAGVLGTRVCFNNSARREVVIEIQDADTGKGTNHVPQGSRFCAEGYAHFVQTYLQEKFADVLGTVDKGNTHPIGIEAHNPHFGRPMFTIMPSTCRAPEDRWGEDVNDTQHISTPDITMDVVRKPDGQWKNFEVYLTPSNGETVNKCRISKE